MVGIGLFGLLASFHGLLLAGGRASYEMGKVGQLPALLGKIHPTFQTPATALVVNAIIGIGIVLTNATAEIITLSVFGALTLYIIAMLSVIKLRNYEPGLNRPFRVPGYPFTPYIALVLSAIALLSLIWYNATLAIGFFLIMGISFVLFKWKSS